jgi:hypothetical protein
MGCRKIGRVGETGRDGGRAKSDPGKLGVVARLRRETTVTIGWIAARLRLGSWKSLNARLHLWRKTNENDHQ